jgi:hypothetical protein
MKQIVLTFCVFFAFITSVNAGPMYRCIDRDGNAIITDIPQDGMIKCVLVESDEEPSLQEPTNEKKKAIVKKDNDIVKEKETHISRKIRINDCFNCCYNKILTCYNYTADGRRCIAEKQSCEATCNSEGVSPSSWSDCWSQSDK